MRWVFAVALAVGLSACQTDTPTASGSPEVTLRGLKPQQVKPQVVTAALNNGLRLTGDTEYQLTFERPWGGLVGQAIVGPLISANSKVSERLTFAMADVGGGTRVVADRYMVKVGAFGREEANPANMAPGLEPLQTTLEKVTGTIR